MDKYFTPFLSPNGNLAFQQKELDEVTQGEPDTVPQLLTNRGDYFVWAARELYAMGLSARSTSTWGAPPGPSPPSARGRGCWPIRRSWSGVWSEIFAALPDMRVSIKTRIGKNDPAEWERLLAHLREIPHAAS